MKNFIFLGVLFLSIQSGQAQFIRMPLNYPHDSTFYSSNVMSIVDHNHVWIATQRQTPTPPNYQLINYSKAVKTTDGGNTWQFFQIPATGSPGLIDVEAQSDSICYYLIDDLNTFNSDIWKTVDGGISWSKKTTSQFNASFGDFIHLFSKDTLIAVGDPSNGYFTIQITNDGGETWTRVPQSNIPAITPNEEGIGGKSFGAIGNTIWFGTSSGRCFKSTDRGNYWTVSNVNSNTSPQMPYVCFSDPQHGIYYTDMFDPWQFIYYTTIDGGQTWTNISILTNLAWPYITRVDGIFEGFIIAATDTVGVFPPTYVFFTNDFFNTLTRLDSVILSSNYIYFKDSTTGWLSGALRPDSNIYKFTNVLTSIRDKHIVKGNIIITPNPTCNSSLITFPSEFISERKILKVFAISGKLMKEYTLTANVKSFELNAAGYSNGVYIIELISDTGLNKIARWVVIH